MNGLNKQTAFVFLLLFYLSRDHPSFDRPLYFALSQNKRERILLSYNNKQATLSRSTRNVRWVQVMQWLRGKAFLLSLQRGQERMTVSFSSSFWDVRACLIPSAHLRVPLVWINALPMYFPWVWGRYKKPLSPSVLSATRKESFPPSVVSLR